MTCTCLADLDPAALSHAERIASLRSCERAIAALQAQQLRLLAALELDPLHGEDGKQFVREEVRTALRWSASMTSTRMVTAEALAGPLAATMTALQDGRISVAQAEAIAHETLAHEEIAADLETAVLDFATTRDLAATRRKIDREMLRLVPADQAYEEAREQRRVWSMPDGVGMSFLGAVLPAEGAATVLHALAFMASQVEDGDCRTKDQRVADALVQLAQDVLAGGCSHCGLPARAAGPAVQVSVALSTVLGLDDEAGELNGAPIPAALARNLANDETGTWRRLVTDDLGQLLDYGRTTYRPPVALHDHVVARDRTCRFPDCNRRALGCELDHVTAWQDGGKTNADNLLALCKRHHHLKHEAEGWLLRMLNTDVAEWTRPAGEVLTTEPARYPIDRSSVDSSVAIDGSTVNRPRVYIDLDWAA